MITAYIAADSVNPVGCRITSFVLVYPRFIHSELLTHRVFSRNAASSRAIPIAKMIERIRKDPAKPISWGKNRKGMQAVEELDLDDRDKAESIWLAAMRVAINYAEELSSLGVHKQVANRLLEPFSHMTTLVTATEWGNFFNLRTHKCAQPEFQELAFQMVEAYRDNQPKKLFLGQWHLPFADHYLDEGLSEAQLLKIVTARAARISYLNFEGNIDHEKDYALHDQLLADFHLSPFEHAARAREDSCSSGNFRGFDQYRKMIVGENKKEFSFAQLLSGRA